MTGVDLELAAQRPFTALLTRSSGRHFISGQRAPTREDGTIKGTFTSVSAAVLSPSRREFKLKGSFSIWSQKRKKVLNFPRSSSSVT